MAITAGDVKRLRETTGAGMMDCKKALGETNGEFDKAVEWLREKGIASAAKRAGRVASEGAVFSYIHMGGKIGVLVEINSETDFVARSEPFQAFGKDVCLQICSTNPQYLRREEVPAELVENEKNIYKRQAAGSGKPEQILDKIAEGKLNKWYQDVCLIEQDFVKDPDHTIEELMKELSGKIGEKIEIRRFSRFALGESLEDEESGAEAAE
ncbi:MAG: translation elongation factor Ts [Candidatus Hydrogenedentes bacterium]|nr:translation elongation factor Ts [Candidatus Hydrogenedentota bacterium]